jgi:hypothetical protein
LMRRASNTPGSSVPATATNGASGVWTFRISQRGS